MCTTSRKRKHVSSGSFSPDEELDIKCFFPDHVRKGVKPAAHLCRKYLIQHRNDKGRSFRDIQDKVKNLYNKEKRDRERET